MNTNRPSAPTPGVSSSVFHPSSLSFSPPLPEHEERTNKPHQQLHEEDATLFIQNLIYNVRLHTIMHMAHEPLSTVLPPPPPSSSVSSLSLSTTKRTKEHNEQQQPTPSSEPKPTDSHDNNNGNGTNTDDNSWIRDEIYTNPEAIKHHYIRIGQNLEFGSRRRSALSPCRERPRSSNERDDNIPNTFRSSSSSLHLLLQTSRALRQESENTFALLNS